MYCVRFICIAWLRNLTRRTLWTKRRQSVSSPTDRHSHPMSSGLWRVHSSTTRSMTTSWPPSYRNWTNLAYHHNSPCWSIWGQILQVACTDSWQENCNWESVDWLSWNKLPPISLTQPTSCKSMWILMTNNLDGSVNLLLLNQYGR